MRLDDEMRAAIESAWREYITQKSFAHPHDCVFVAGYRLALERAARTLEERDDDFGIRARWAKRIRALGSEQ